MSENIVLGQREQLVLSSLLFDKECQDWAKFTGAIDPDLFENGQIKHIVRALIGVIDTGDDASETLLLDQLAGANVTDRKNWKLFLDKLQQEVPPEPKEALEKHLGILQNAQMMKKYGKIAQNVLGMVNNHNPFETEEEKRKVKHYIENAFFELQERNKTDSPQANMQEGINKTIEAMKESLNATTSASISCGYDEMDHVLDGGFKKGTFAICAARPGMGKTVWMLNSAVETAKTGSRVLFISIEMSLLQCFQRLLAKLANISGRKIQQPALYMTDKDWADLANAAKEIVTMFGDNFWVQEITEMSVPQLERIIKHYKKKYDIDAVYVDYAQIMLTKDGDEPKEASDFAQISGGLRRAAKNHDVAIVVGSQLSREVERRNDKRPIMADIRNSGAFEQDAAYIFALYRDEVYNEESEEPNTLEVIFLKNRFGKNGDTLKFNYDLEKQAILSQAESFA